MSSHQIIKFLTQSRSQTLISIQSERPLGINISIIKSPVKLSSIILELMFIEISTILSIEMNSGSIGIVSSCPKISPDVFELVIVTFCFIYSELFFSLFPISHSCPLRHQTYVRRKHQMLLFGQAYPLSAF